MYLPYIISYYLCILLILSFERRESSLLSRMVVDYSASTLWNPWFDEKKNTASKNRFDSSLLKILQYVYKKGVLLLLCWDYCRQKCLVLDYLASLFFYSVVFYFIFTYSTIGCVGLLTVVVHTIIMSCFSWICLFASSIAHNLESSR